MADRHTYASVDELRDYLAGTSYSSGWTQDGSSLSLILESASRRIDDYCGGGMFGPKIMTRYYDIGSGSLIQSPQYRQNDYGQNIGVADSFTGVIPLDGWLISTTTVTSYKQTARTESETLTEGYANDFFLMPYNFNPKTMLKLNKDTAKTFHSGQQTLTILGTWGYQEETQNVTTADAISSTSATSISVASAANLGVAQTILIGSEALYITAISGNTLTVERSVNGTSASTHSGGANLAKYIYPETVVQVCKDIAKIIYRDRDLGVTQSIGTEMEAITVAQNEINNELAVLNSFRAGSTSNGVIF